MTRLVITIALFLGLTWSASAQLAEIRMAVESPPRTPVWRGAQLFRDSVNRRLEKYARVELKIIGNGEALSAVQSGAFQMAVLRTDLLAKTKTGEMVLFDLPFFFENLEETVAMQNSTIGEVLLGSLNLNGLVGLTYWNHGMNQLFGDRSIASSGDLKGIKVGTTVSPSARYAVQSLGVTMTSLSLKDVTNALQKGAVDLVETPAVFVSEGIVPLKDAFYSKVNYRPAVLAVVANKKFWKSATLRVQKALVEEARAASQQINLDAIKSDQAALGAFIKGPFKVRVAEPSDLGELSKASEPGWYKVEALSRPTTQDRTFLDSALFFRSQLRKTKTAPKDQKLRKGELGTKRSTVLFATDRRNDSDPDPELRFAGARGIMNWGEAMLAIDPNRSLGSGDIATIQLRKISELRTQAGFVEAARKRLEAAGRKEALIYVHGYRTTFAQALASAAQIAVDARFPGVVGAFSWPSDGTTLSYFYDEEEVKGSRDNLQKLIGALKRAGAERIHLVTHSMGGRLAVNAIEWAGSGNGAINFLLYNAIFAAPDVRTNLFLNAVPRMMRRTKRITLYASKWDQALMCSRLLHRGARAGQGGKDIVVVDEVDSVDASKVEKPSWQERIPCTPFGHFYLHQNSAVLSDVYELLAYDVGPNRRHRLHKRRKRGLVFWLIQ